jgi:uncharacterized repeat protein (TIGR03806 family)
MWRSWMIGFSVVMVVVVVAGCVDQPVLLSPPGSTARVSRLSELGIFVGPPAAQVPAPGFVPYEVVAPLYSDLASKQRFLYVPPGTTMRYDVDRWELPLGAMLVKTFYYPRDANRPDAGRQLIETRVLAREGHGLRAGTYLWNAAQDDAVASGGNLDVATSWLDENGADHEDHFHVPGTTQCQSCHDQHALGLRTRQMNRTVSIDGNEVDQIDRLVALGVLDGVAAVRAQLDDPFGSAPIERRARSYLDANCGHCHSPEGEASSTRLFLDRASDNPGICRHTARVGGSDRVVVPGRPEASVMLKRMRAGDPDLRMPRGPTHIPDARGLALLEQWIAGQTPAGCP